jgi:hypothetical protein
MLKTFRRSATLKISPTPSNQILNLRYCQLSEIQLSLISGRLPMVLFLMEALSWIFFEFVLLYKGKPAIGLIILMAGSPPIFIAKSH